MLPEKTSDAGIELHYTLSREDLVDGLAVQQRVARRAWWQRPGPLRLLVAGGMLIFVVILGLSKGMSGAQFVAFILITLFAVGIGLAVARPLDPNRLTRRLAVRQIMGGNPVFADPITCVVSPSGVRASTASGASTLNWSHFPYHAETDSAFALLASDRLGAAVQVLPKRGLDEAAIASLRALIASHSRALT
jgi:hypothetical protein